MTHRASVGLAVALALVGAGCSGLPTAGPTSSQIGSQTRSAEARRLGIVLVDATPDVIDWVANARRTSSLSATFGEGVAAVPKIGVGDVLSITIWEAGTGTLFSTPAVPGQSLQPSRGQILPNMTVQPDGMITVPYAGRIPVVGLQPAQLEQTIVQRLAGKAVDPQVLVTISSSNTNTVTVGGGGAPGARVPLSPGGERILDAVAMVGGLRVSPDDVAIYVTRGGHTVEVPYDEILDNPKENIFLKGGDILTIAGRPSTFLAFGAVLRNGQIPFDAHTISLDEAVAKSAGLNDMRADPEGVFLLRNEPADLARRLAPGRVAPNATLVPVVYRFNFRDTAQIFLASRFMMQDKDVIYVANAPLTELEKFFNLIGTLMAPAGTAASAGAAAVTFGR